MASGSPVVLVRWVTAVAVDQAGCESVPPGRSPAKASLWKAAALALSKTSDQASSISALTSSNDASAVGVRPAVIASVTCFDPSWPIAG